MVRSSRTACSSGVTSRSNHRWMPVIGTVPKKCVCSRSGSSLGSIGQQLLKRVEGSRQNSVVGANLFSANSNHDAVAVRRNRFDSSAQMDFPAACLDVAAASSVELRQRNRRQAHASRFSRFQERIAKDQRGVTHRNTVEIFIQRADQAPAPRSDRSTAGFVRDARSQVRKSSPSSGGSAGMSAIMRARNRQLVTPDRAPMRQEMPGRGMHRRGQRARLQHRRACRREA